MLLRSGRPASMVYQQVRGLRALRGAAEFLLEAFRRGLLLLSCMHEPGSGHPYVALAVSLPEEHHPGSVLGEESLPCRLVSRPGMPGEHSRHVVQGRILGRSGGVSLVSCDVLSGHQFPAVQFEFNAVGALGLSCVLFDEDVPLGGHGGSLSSLGWSNRD